MEVIYLADKYMLPFLEKRCYNYLANELTPGEVFHVLPQAKKTGNTKAEELCWNIVDLETLPAVTSQPFLNISRDLLKQVLERETLQAEEIDLFKAIDAWASNRIGNGEENQNGEAKREELGDEVVQLIRFPVMTQKEFAEEVIVCNILKQNEVTEVVQIFNSIEPLSTSFKRIKREGQWNEKWTENRFNHVQPISTQKPCDDNNCIAFHVNKPLFLAGIRLFSSTKDTGMPIRIKIKMSTNLFEESQTDQRDLRITCNPQHQSNGYSLYTVKIDPPMILEPFKTYSVSAIMDSTASCSMYRGSGGKGEITISPDIKLTLVNEIYNSINPKTTVDFGQFPSFLLKRKIKVGNDNESASGIPSFQRKIKVGNENESESASGIPSFQREIKVGNDNESESASGIRRLPLSNQSLFANKESLSSVGVSIPSSSAQQFAFGASFPFSFGKA